LIWLSQALYIDKIARLIDKKNLRHGVLITQVKLKPYKGLTTASSINKYQRKAGSILFTAVTTRPDIAFDTSRLARFLSNPSPEHHDAADRVLLYLQSTRTLALQLGGNDNLLVASDALFADNTLNRKSSQAYVIKLLGGLITWRANK
jgi:CO/xanthine dehydrogenase FAD-binding subunit